MANGSSIKVLGSIDLDFKIAGIKLKHEFIVVTDLNRNIILGRDFLMKNKVRIYCDLHKLKLQNAYVPLENDVHISAISRLNKTITLKPQTAYLVEARLKRTPYLCSFTECTINKLEKGFLNDQPELELTPIVATVVNGKFPIQIVNKSNKFIRLKKGCVIGKISPVTPNQKTVNSVKHVTGSHKVRVTDENFYSR